MKHILCSSQKDHKGGGSGLVKCRLYLVTYCHSLSGFNVTFYSGQKIKKKWWVTVYSSKVQQSHLRVTNLYATPVSHIYFCVWVVCESPPQSCTKNGLKNAAQSWMKIVGSYLVKCSVRCDLVLFAVCTPRRKAFIPEGRNNSKMNIIKKRLLAVVVWGGKWAFHIVELWTPGGDAWWIRRDGCRDRNVVPYLVSRQDYLIYPQIMYIYIARDISARIPPSGISRHILYLLKQLKEWLRSMVGGSGKEEGGREGATGPDCTCRSEKSSESIALYRYFQDGVCPSRALWFPVNP